MHAFRTIAIRCSAVALSCLLVACGGKEARLAEHLKKGRDLYAAGEIEKAKVELKNVLQMDPKTAEPYLIFGKMEEQRGNFQKAFGNYLRATELDPANAEMRTRLGKLYLFGGDLKNAEASINEVLAKHPDDPAVLTLKAAYLGRSGDTAAAVATAQRVIERSPTHADAYGVVAGLYKAQNKTDAAIAVLEQGIRAIPKTLELRVLLANILVATKAEDRAIQQYKDLIGLEPGRLDFRVQLARLYVARKDPAAAERVLREAVQAAPDDDQPTLALTEFLLSSGKRDVAEKELVAAIKSRPDAYPLRFALAALHVAQGSVDKAEQDYDAIIKRAQLAPDGLRARTALAAIRLGQERTEEAAGLLADVLKENPRDNGALLLRSKMALARGDAVNAIADLRSVMKDQPDSLDVITRLAQAHLVNHEPQLAVETIGRATDVRPDDPAARLLVAEVKASTGDHQGALDEVEAALKLDPKNYPALLRKTELQAALKKGSDAEKTLALLREIRPDDPQVPYRLGMLLLGAGKLVAAEAEFNHALALRPGALEPLTALTNVYFAQKKADKAVQTIEQSLADKPQQFAVQVLLGRAYERMGQYAQAEAALRKAIEIQPRAEPAHQELAAFFERRGNRKAAEQALVSALAALPDSLGLRMRLAEVQRRGGAVDQAIAQYERILKSRPGNDAAANNLASLLLDARQDKRGFDRALQLASRFKVSQNLAYLDTLGWARVQAGQFDDAIPLLRKVAEAAPDVAVFQYHLGAALLKNGDRVLARPVLERAVNAKGDYPGKGDARALLGSIS